MFDMNKILVIGKNSFIGSNFARWSKCADIISHTEIDSVDFKNYNAVVNCCISPDYRNSVYDEKNDIDFIVSKKAQKSNIRHVMISSRKVYGTSNELKTYTEDSPINPVDFYSENKFITEEKIRNNLEKYTILRGTNVFGNEYGRKSFMGFCLTQLKDNDKIIFNISGDIKRDFVHVDEVSRILKKVCSVGKNDTYNLSSGYGLTISDISKLLIAGKGSGEFECSGPILDQFILSNYKLCHDFDLSVKKEYTYDILMIGKKYG
jgi:nucleoside-diphosphate-sugar epimerase